MIMSNCSADLTKTSDSVTLKNFLEEDLPAGKTLSFSVGPVKNPLSGKRWSGFQLIVKDQDGGSVMESDGWLKITQPATIDASQVELTVENTEVEDLSVYDLSVKLPVPLEAGCRVTITIPEQVEFGIELKSIQVSGIFGAYREVSFSI
jgi:hypothetical protein